MKYIWLRQMAALFLITHYQCLQGIVYLIKRTRGGGLPLSLLRDP